MLRWVQNKPHVLEILYDLTHKALVPFARWLKPGGSVERVFVAAEEVSKSALFNCKMCGQCVLHSTGMTCPMNCPKNLRNGPCGGVRANGHCEVRPEMKCVWLEAVTGAARIPGGMDALQQVQVAVDRRLEGRSSWLRAVRQRVGDLS